LAKNAKLFMDKDTLPLKCVNQSLNILSEFPQLSYVPPHAQVSACHINESFPWNFFNIASQSNPSKGGVGGIIFLSKNHLFSFKDRISHAKNNYRELATLKLILILSLEKGLSHIQILGDSLLVIQ
jgi:hypothetical protein